MGTVVVAFFAAIEAGVSILPRLLGLGDVRREYERECGSREQPKCSESHRS